MKLTSHQVLRALSRFDVATVEDVATALHRNNPSQQRNVWSRLQVLVADGLASRDGERGHVARYAITEQGRQQLKEAA